MNKKQLYDAMGGRISKAPIGWYSNEIVITGKFGIISWMDGYWDIWITGKHRKETLTNRKVSSLCSAIKTLVKTIDTEFAGEAVGSCTSDEAAYQIAVIIGARKKRKASPKQLANLKNAA